MYGYGCGYGGHETEDYKRGYGDGLEYGYAVLTSEYASMDTDQMREYEKGMRNGLRERWRREEEEDYY